LTHNSTPNSQGLKWSKVYHHLPAIILFEGGVSFQRGSLKNIHQKARNLWRGTNSCCRVLVWNLYTVWNVGIYRKHMKNILAGKQLWDEQDIIQPKRQVSFYNISQFLTCFLVLRNTKETGITICKILLGRVCMKKEFHIFSLCLEKYFYWHNYYPVHPNLKHPWTPKPADSPKF